VPFLRKVSNLSRLRGLETACQALWETVPPLMAALRCRKRSDLPVKCSGIEEGDSAATKSPRSAAILCCKRSDPVFLAHILMKQTVGVAKFLLRAHLVCCKRSGLDLQA